MVDALVELVVVVTIIGLLAAIAVPSFATLIAGQRASSAASDIYLSLMTARSEATKRGVNVTLAQKTGGWKNGWEIINPADSTKKLLDHDALPSATVGSTADVVYQSSGRVSGGTSPAFTVTFTTGSASVTKNICVDLSGRPFVQTASCP